LVPPPILLVVMFVVSVVFVVVAFVTISEKVVPSMSASVVLLVPKPMVTPLETKTSEPMATTLVKGAVLVVVVNVLLVPLVTTKLS
jgi:hypothetical protein